MENNFLTIEHKTLQTEGFLKTSPVHCQRLIEHRINGITKVLSVKLIPTHLEVSIIKVNFSDNYYQKGHVYSINGNTRKQIWSDNPDMKPDFVYTTIYFADNRKQVEEIYNSIDSTKSVENTGDKISGLYRANNIEPKSKKFLSRGIGRPLQLAYLCYNNGDSKKTLITEIDNKQEFEFFKDVLSFLDTQYITFNNDKIKTKKFASSNIMAALLIIGKKYGVNHPRYTLLVHNLFNEIAVRKEGIGGLNDGVSVVWGNLYEKHQNNGWTDASGGGGPLMIGRILYCFDAFMNNTDISVRNNTSIKGIVLNDEKSKEYFKTYITSIV